MSDTIRMELAACELVIENEIEQAGYAGAYRTKVLVFFCDYQDLSLFCQALWP